MANKLTTEEFISKAQAIHGDRYDYSLVEYKRSIEQVSIICREHGVFPQRASDHLSGKGCKKCHISSYDTPSFVAEAQRVHGNKYDYSQVDYKGATSPITIICAEHGPFQSLPDYHIHRKRGCQSCRPPMVDDLSSFLAKARTLHGDTYDYSKVDYQRSAQYVTITCRKHGDFKQTPCTHLTEGCGCPKCAKYGFNQIDPAVLYVYRMENVTNATSFIGFGITAHFSTRDNSHRLQASRSGFALTLVACKEFVIGDDALRIEKVIKKSIPCVDTGVRGFRTEAANESSLPDILRILNAA